MEKQFTDEDNEIINDGLEFTKQILTILSQRFASNYNKSSLKKRLSKEDNNELLDIISQSLAETEESVEFLFKDMFEGGNKDAWINYWL